MQVQRFALAELFAATWTADTVRALDHSLFSLVFQGLTATGMRNLWFPQSLRL